MIIKEKVSERQFARLTAFLASDENRIKLGKDIHAFDMRGSKVYDSLQVARLVRSSSSTPGLYAVTLEFQYSYKLSKNHGAESATMELVPGNLALKLLSLLREEA